MSKYSTDYWTDLLDEQGGDLNATAKLLGWLREESGGNPGALGTRYEVGIFQIDLEDGPAYGGTLATLHGNFCASPTSQVLTRELTADEEALQVSSGLAMIRKTLTRSQAELDAHGLSWSNDDLWCLVKLWHALPRLWDQYLAAAADAGAASSWSDFRDWTTSLSQSDAAQVNSAVAAKYFPFDKYFENAEKVGYAGGINEPVGSADLGLLLVLAVVAVLATRFVF